MSIDKTINNTQTTDNTEIVTEFITKVQAEQRAVDEYCKSFPNPEEIDLVQAEGCILRLTYLYFNMHNENAPKDEKWHKSHELKPHMIARILSYKYVIRNLNLGGKTSVLAIYVGDGPEAGIYILDTVYSKYLTDIINRVSPAIEKRQVDEVREKLRSNAPCAKRTEDSNLIPVGNGIFDCRTQELKPFRPDYVFTEKLATAYKDHPVNPVIHNDADGTDWDVESWIASLSDDPEVVNLLWCVIYAVVHPLKKWDKLICLCGSSGCNGKSTIIQMMRDLCGEDYYVSLSLQDICDRYLPPDFASKKAIIGDENVVGGYLELTAILKAIITGNLTTIEPKYRDKIPVCFQGVVVQCLNSYVKFRDRTDSMYRRLLMIPFLKRFLGDERKYIKDDYLRRSEVLEYVLWRVLNMPEFDKLPEPEACEIELEKYKNANDPLRVFLGEILPELAWSTVPFTFLYDLYKEWIKRNNPSGKMSSKGEFENNVMEFINTNRSNNCYAAWEVIAKEPPRTVPKGDLNTPEPLILEYKLTDWMNPSATNSNDVDKVCVSPKLKTSYRGGIRRA